MYHQEGSDTLYVGGQAMIYVLTFTNRGVDDLQVTKSTLQLILRSEGFRQSLLLPVQTNCTAFLRRCHFKQFFYGVWTQDMRMSARS